MNHPRPRQSPHHLVRRAFTFAFVIAIGLFYAHIHALFLIATSLSAADLWLTQHLSHEAAGRTIILLVFVLLFVVHILEAAVWGAYLRHKRLSATLIEGIYFSATSITGLGYGDVVLPSPWRLLGPVITITGLLMFGCSAAFLFLVLQKVWAQLL